MQKNSSGEFGYVINVQRFTVHDGPGIRTELFLKGCPLRCKWCSNPESYEIFPQVGVFEKKCIGISKCGYCISVCPVKDSKAIIIENDIVISIDRTLCTNCLRCESDCPSGALKLWGEKLSVEKAMKHIRADRSFYEKSGGGVTLSGGEALLQWRFCLNILKMCRSEGINTCVESALHIDPKILDEVVPYTDIFITDIKHMDNEIHRQQTGVGNKLILSNITKLMEMEIPVIIRIPVIPGFNDSIESMDEISNFILTSLQNKVETIQVIRYRPLGEEKNKALGLKYKMEGINPDRSEFEERIKGYVARMVEKGLPAIAGTTKKNVKK